MHQVSDVRALQRPLPGLVRWSLPEKDAALQAQEQAMSKRSIQRRFRHATGLSLRALQSIERARHAAALLQQGVSLLDTVEEAGYFDQPHLTRSLKQFIGYTPAQIIRLRKTEQLAI